MDTKQYAAQHPHRKGRSDAEIWLAARRPATPPAPAEEPGR